MPYTFPRVESIDDWSIDLCDATGMPICPLTWYTKSATTTGLVNFEATAIAGATAHKLEGGSLELMTQSVEYQYLDFNAVQLIRIVPYNLTAQMLWGVIGKPKWGYNPRGRWDTVKISFVGVEYLLHSRMMYYYDGAAVSGIGIVAGRADDLAKKIVRYTCTATAGNDVDGNSRLWNWGTLAVAADTSQCPDAITLSYGDKYVDETIQALSEKYTFDYELRPTVSGGAITYTFATVYPRSGTDRTTDNGAVVPVIINDYGAMIPSASRYRDWWGVCSALHGPSFLSVELDAARLTTWGRWEGQVQDSADTNLTVALAEADVKDGYEWEFESQAAGTSCRWLEDWFIGDLITRANVRLGISAGDGLIEAVTFRFDQPRGLLKLKIRWGDKEPGIVEKTKRGGRGRRPDPTYPAFVTPAIGFAASAAAGSIARMIRSDSTIKLVFAGDAGTAVPTVYSGNTLTVAGINGITTSAAGNTVTVDGVGLAPANHNLLSATHGDTLAATVVDGSIIIGNVTPKWSALPISVPGVGICNYLGVNNAELRPSWKSGSSNPGAAASLLASNASGYLQLTGLGIGVAAGAANRITMADGGTIGQAAGPLITFDDTNNRLNITGCNVGIAATATTAYLTIGTSRIFTYTSVGRAGIQAAAGGWTIGYQFSGSAATELGGYGAFGSDDVLTYFWIGPSYSAPWMVLRAGDIGIGIAVPLSKTHIVGDLRLSSAGDLLIYFDASITLKASIDGATGDLFLASAATTQLGGYTYTWPLAGAVTGEVLQATVAGAAITLDWVSPLTFTHNLLSATHADTVASAVAVGDIIVGVDIGGAVLRWDNLAVTIPAATFMKYLGTSSASTGPTYQDLFAVTVPGTIAESAAAAAGTAVTAARIDHTHGAPATWAATAHPLLGSTRHNDTLTGTVVDGDVIIGNVTPAWSRLAISVPAANVRNVLGIDNTELRPSWKTALDATNPITLTVATTAAPGTSLIFSHRDHAHAITSSSNPGAAASILASDANGFLQLTRLGLGVAPAGYLLQSAGNIACGWGAASARIDFIDANSYIIRQAGSFGIITDMSTFTLQCAGALSIFVGGVSRCQVWTDRFTGTTDNTIALGDTTHRWTTIYTMSGISYGNWSLYSGGDLTVYSDAGITTVASIDGATGNFWLVTAATTKFGGGTYTWPAADAAGYLTSGGAGNLSWSSTAVAAPHNILDSNRHSDVLTGSVLDGSIIIGNVTPKWSALVASIPASAATLHYLGINFGDLRPAWKVATTLNTASSVVARDASSYINATRYNSASTSYYAEFNATGDTCVVLAGNIVMAATKTVDGVDVSAHSHHYICPPAITGNYAGHAHNVYWQCANTSTVSGHAHTYTQVISSPGPGEGWIVTNIEADHTHTITNIADTHTSAPAA